MKNAVLLAPYFLPRRRVGSWRPFKFAIHLREFGWQPHIITIQDQSGTLTPKERKLLEDIPVYQLEPLFDFTEKSGSQLTKASKEKENSGDNPLQPALDWIDKQFPADTWLPFFWVKYLEVVRIFEEISPVVLWSTGDPWSGHWLAKALSRKFAVPWIADFRDPWTLGNVNLKDRSVFSSMVDRRLEAGVVGQASELTFTSKATEQLYRQHYPEQRSKMHTIYNAFDDELYEKTEMKQNLFDDSKLNLLFFGKFRRLSPAKPFIDLLDTLAPEVADNIIMHSFGPLSDADRAYAARHNCMDNFTQLDPIPAEQMRAILPAADILWLSTNQDRAHIIPAKLWDYLAAGRPIISTAPNPEIKEILESTRTGIQFSPDDENALIHLLQQCVRAKRDGEVLPIDFDPEKKGVKQYEATQATRSLAQLFDSIS